jgi:hypothetical protein
MSIKIYVNDRMGRKTLIECEPENTILEIKAMVSARVGTPKERIRLSRGSQVLRDALSLEDYEVATGSSLDMSA